MQSLCVFLMGERPVRSKQLYNYIMEVDYYLFIDVYEFWIEKCCQTVLHCECTVI